jgi:3',5'-cyclic AMP phosphodiesterase CpdA
MPETAEGHLLAVSDLHVSYAENRSVVDDLIHPITEDDWLIVAGDIAETVSSVTWGLERLAKRFRKVIWTPGNHELWTHPQDEVTLRGEERYRHLVQICRDLGIVTPEDEYPVWNGVGGPVVVAPMFLLYDYSFMPAGATTKEEGLALAYQAGVVCTDEFLLHPDPHPSRDAWCRERVELTRRRLAEVPGDMPTILVNHFPLERHPTDVLRHPEFAQWCGTDLTATWHRDFRAKVVVYGHLHIPRTTWLDGTRFEEVSLGYPRERKARPTWPVGVRQILPAVGESG